MALFFRNHGVLILLFIAQICFWANTRHILPDMAIVPDVPGRDVVKALSLGDEQFYFRYLALDIQNAGDTYGRFTPLKDYDYNKLSKWFHLLDSLDNTSNFIPSLASYYYSQTQHTPDVRYVVDYLYDHSAWRPDQKWWWLIQAVYLANHKLNDKPLALKMAKPMENAKHIPLWARHFSAFIYEQMGEPQQALYVMEHVLKGAKENSLSREDFNFMKYFIEQRLKEETPQGFDNLAPKDHKPFGKDGMIP